MELILFRHGHAEERGSREKDDDRELTDKGRDIVRRVAKSLKCFLPKRHTIYIWTSPLIRARQTAEIVANVLEIRRVTELPAIASGDLTMLSEELAKLGTGTCAIIIGHEPYLSEWSEQISGVVLPFKKGAAAGIKLVAANPPEGELYWFVSRSF